MMGEGPMDGVDSRLCVIDFDFRGLKTFPSLRKVTCIERKGHRRQMICYL